MSAMRPRRRSPEAAIQRCVFQHLRARGAPGVFAFHPANGGYRTPIEAAVLVGRAEAKTPEHVPLVGREMDLAHLELIAARVLTEHRPFLVSLIAPAGADARRARSSADLVVSSTATTAKPPIPRRCRQSPRGLSRPGGRHITRHA